MKQAAQEPAPAPRVAQREHWRLKMQRQFLLITVATAALSFGAYAQTGGSSGGTGASPGTGGAQQQQPRTGPSTTGNDRSTGQAPGLEQRGSPPPGVGQGSDRAQERRTGEQPSTQTSPDRSGSGTTSGQRSGSDTQTGASSGNDVKVTSEQQTRIHSVVSKVKIKEVSNLNVNVAVGTILPTTVELEPVPTEIVEIVPQFRSYRVIKVSGRILIVEPSTRRIVYIINA